MAVARCDRSGKEKGKAIPDHEEGSKADNRVNGSAGNLHQNFMRGSPAECLLDTFRRREVVGKKNYGNGGVRKEIKVTSKTKDHLEEEDVRKAEEGAGRTRDESTNTGCSSIETSRGPRKPNVNSKGWMMEIRVGTAIRKSDIQGACV
jgi:hypothetical protein